MTLKPALNYENQIRKFKNDHNLAISDDEDISIISKRLMEKNKIAYEELAK